MFNRTLRNTMSNVFDQAGNGYHVSRAGVFHVHGFWTPTRGSNNAFAYYETSAVVNTASIRAVSWDLGVAVASQDGGLPDASNKFDFIVDITAEDLAAGYIEAGKALIQKKFWLLLSKGVYKNPQ